MGFESIFWNLRVIFVVAFYLVKLRENESGYVLISGA